MDFIKKMKTREFIEMSLKTLAAILAVFLVFLLMEGMIYSIQLDQILKNKNANYSYGENSIIYCLEDKEKKGMYKVMLYNNDGEDAYWCTETGLLSKSVIESKFKENEVIYRLPNAFELSLEGFHFIILSIVVAGVAGFYVWRFISLANSYKKIEAQYAKDGTIEFAS